MANPSIVIEIELTSVHSALERLASRIYEETGICVESAHFRWIGISSAVSILEYVSVNTTSSSGSRQAADVRRSIAR